MSVLDVRKYPDKILCKRANEVPVVDAEVRRLLDDMAMTMYAVSGVGLAGPQVGIDMRLIVIDVGKGLLKLVNPKIIASEGESVLEEGCLSIPDVTVRVKRAAKVRVKALNNEGKDELIEAEGLLAHAFQQEIDHLDGKLIIDYLPFYKKIFIKKRLS
ncbi:MAG: peptide deformylase [Candidatus Omnitrophota bacterium]